MDIINTGTASLDLLFMTTEERAASDASRILKKLINYILDHLDDKQAPPSIQDLRNDAFARGFQAGYRKAYQQWGEEVEERIDEAYRGGIADERRQWKGKQTRTETADGSTQTPTITIETAVQTNAAPDRRCAALQTEPPENEELTTLKNACVDFNTQATPQTTETATQTLVEHPSTPLDAATSLPTTPTQPPSAMSTLPSTMTTLLTTTAATSSPAPNQSPAPRKRWQTLLS
jgi:hypothetical protein